MPPTIQQPQVPNQNEKRPVKPGEKRSELICRVKYCNTLPDIPFDLKFISYPFESSRFIQYNPTSLERNYRYEVLTEHDLGVNIDLINKDIYSVEPGAILDPADEKLLEEDILTPQDSKRSRHHARSVSWLRRTEYISTEQTRFQPQTMDKVEAKVGYSIKKNLKNETLYMDRDSQIKAIEKTFEDSKIPIEKHYSKPNVYPVEVLPVYPDFKLWKYPCAQVIFDSDPAPVGKQIPAQIEEMSQAMIRGVMDESGEQFVAYFLPTEETLEKRRNDFAQGISYQDDEEYEYKMAREYNWNVKSKASKGYEENYFLVVRQDGIYYNELETRVRLSKRRQKAGQATSNTRLIVKHRPMDAQEFRMQRYREKQLEPPGDEDEEYEQDQVEETQEEQAEESQAESDQEKQSNKDEASENEHEKSDAEKSRASSRASSRSSNHSEKSGSRSPSRSRSSSRSKSRSRSKSKSPSRSRSPSRSKSRSKSPSKSRSPSRSKSRSQSRSPSGSRSRSQSGSRSPSDNESKSGSGSGSDNGSNRASDSE
ncbi:RNA polymerase II-associated factor 1 homolog [Agrilus planipennis]|uniref:RNA polymerase II-associated factor 1 homolog n=1 Tax=Agrilus planipennis TaxID=224129 RepID=A0A1W4X9Y1_AGRPL|nr:RNA polymerase II-associated factor 1 homolog [Agrilus planipennis]XP_018329218.1 RNA polymerase II-associated factor 1 homolog [Agrilus planipennis]